MALNETIERAAQARDMLASYGECGFQDGNAEPWVADFLASLVRAIGARTVIEIGGFTGRTSARLAGELAAQPWPTSLTVCEIDAARAKMVQDRLEPYAERVACKVVLEDSHRWIPTLPDFSIDFAWVDGNHELPHVTTELHLLYSKMRPGGIIAGHDVWGVCNLWKAFAKFHGYSLNFPRLGPAGGVGIIQVPTEEQQIAYLDG